MLLSILANYTITQIVVFSVSLILAVKGGWDIIDYFRDKYNKKFDKDYERKKKEETLEQHYQNCIKQHDETMTQYNSLNQKLDNIVISIDDLTKRVDTLTESDMHDIKQSIVKDYHYFTEKQGWIDDYSLSVLELRYKDYLEEGGNSFVKTLMEELRTLPKHAPYV